MMTEPENFWFVIFITMCKSKIFHKNYQFFTTSNSRFSRIVHIFQDLSS